MMGTGGTGITGSGNTALGYQAGLLLQGAAANNLILGPNVGSTVLQTGSGNILIGVSANTGVATASTSNFFEIGGNGTTPIMSATGINSTPALTLYGTVTLATLSTGTPATYACFTSGGQIISSATAC